MQTVSIGFFREDGDFQVLATLNNNDGLMGEARFLNMVESLRMTLDAATGETVQVLERQDVADYVTI